MWTVAYGEGVADKEARDGVALTNLDQPLFDGANATKRDLVDYLDAMSDRILPHVRDRPLSVIRALRGQRPFMQKNLPKYTPESVPRVTTFAESVGHDVTYALCNDRPTLLWFANQRAVEYHPTLVRADDWAHPTHLVLDLDPPEGGGFTAAVKAAHLIREVLTGVGIDSTVKTSGAKGVHVFAPIAGADVEEVAAATRAVAARAERLDPQLATTAFIREDRAGKVFLDATRSGGATVVAVYSPRLRDNTTVSFPVGWADIDDVTPADFTIHTAPGLLTSDRWADAMPEPKPLDADLVAEGREIPIARVAAMHEGKRRARARRAAAGDG